MNNLAKNVVFNYGVKKAAIKILKSDVVRSALYNKIHSSVMRSAMKKREEGFPSIIDIEGTNSCSADCIICPHKSMERKVGSMDTRTRACSIMQSRAMRSEVRFAGFGEPFLDKDLKQSIALAQGTKVSINTNGMFLDPYIDGVDTVYVSIDAYYESTYRLIRPGLDFKTVKLNTKRLIQRGKVKVIVSMVENALNQNEVKEFIDEWKDAYAVSVSIMHQWENGKTKERRDPCVLLWTGLNVHWNGDVPLCCLDYEGKHILGNVRKESLLDIWRGDRLREVREKHKQGIYDGICKNCSYNVHHKSPWWLM